MLKNTFQHIRGITALKELQLWENGIVTWDDFEREDDLQQWLFDAGFSSIFSESRYELEKGNADFFAKLLPRNEYYRIALDFAPDTLFLDIETTGLSRYYDYITMIGWSLGDSYDAYIKGTDPRNFLDAISKSKAIVTYNGSLFDLPFIRQEFPDVKLPDIHVDLRFLGRRVGLTGGQKSIENELGLERSASVANILGENAPILWHKYKQGDLKSLKSLIDYNHADVAGLRFIFDHVVDRLLAEKKLLKGVSLAQKFFSWKTKVAWAKSSNGNNGHFIQILPYDQQAGPLFVFEKFPAKVKEKKIVGIDLTGSEARASGWCLLDGNIAYTCKLSSDEEIVSTTLKSGANLISIDSPLSIPEGRLSTTDDDPTRYIYGIMRHCERVLKKRGINVYPSLIPSMQKLTARGIRLASEFRKHGIPVIESYPGAAQDIMNIPRKGASLEYLKKGLYDFGIQGDYVRNDVSHDELDAITSAVVGSFFLSGKFEALGKPTEGYLIVPDLQAEFSNGARIVLGLSGPISAGKTTASRILESYGFTYGRFSAVLKEILESRHEKVNRDSLQKLGDEIYHNPGQRWLCEKLVEKLPETGNSVIDGLRHPEDHAGILEAFGTDFIHIHLKASHDIREKRYLAEGGTNEEFIRAINHPVEAHIPLLASLSDIVIVNESSVEELRDSLLKVVTKLTRDTIKIK